jgi:hypothetical protein
MTDLLLQGGPARAAAAWPYVPLGAGVGPLVGVRLQASADAVLVATAAWRYHAHALRGWALDWQARGRWMLGAQLAIGAEARGGDDWLQSEGMVYWYF